MRAHGRKADLKIMIRLELHSLGYTIEGAIKKNATIGELQQMFSALRREQIERRRNIQAGEAK